MGYGTEKKLEGTWMAIVVIIRALVSEGVLRSEHVCNLLAAAEAEVPDLCQEPPLREIRLALQRKGHKPSAAR